VKDWSNPLQLAAYVTPIPTDPPWTRACYVFPDARRDRYRAETGAEYRSVFVERCAARGVAYEARYAGEIVREAGRLVRSSRSAEPRGREEHA
jgi:hypothetical protein